MVLNLSGKFSIITRKVKMKTWCLKDHATGHIFKVILNEEELQKFLKENPDIDECIDCIECEDAPSITIE